jgi:hypothetical protein
MTHAQVLLSGGKLWLDDDLQLRYDGPPELIPTIREHKAALRIATACHEWRQRCMALAHGSDFAAQWRDLANLPGRKTLGWSDEEIQRAFIVNWKTVQSDLKVCVGDELVGLVNRTFRMKGDTK